MSVIVPQLSIRQCLYRPLPVIAMRNNVCQAAVALQSRVKPYLATLGKTGHPICEAIGNIIGAVHLYEFKGCAAPEHLLEALVLDFCNGNIWRLLKAGTIEEHVPVASSGHLGSRELGRALLKTLTPVKERLITVALASKHRKDKL